MFFLKIYLFIFKPNKVLYMLSQRLPFPQSFKKADDSDQK